jgi:hypothetical protein
MMLNERRYTANDLSQHRKDALPCLCVAAIFLKGPFGKRVMPRGKRMSLRYVFQNTKNSEAIIQQ